MERGVMDIKKIVVKAHVRYWEDTEVNGIDDTENGDNVPCKQGELWSPIIDVATGVIENWEFGKKADCFVLKFTMKQHLFRKKKNLD